jgi:DNA polymerase III subunit epsilon
MLPPGVRVLAFERSFGHAADVPRTSVRLVGRTEPAGQRSFDDLGTPLHDVTFCVIDLETTGGSSESGAITEVGAVKLRGGECIGTLQTLVNPGMAIPREITVLTGITEAMVVPAPTIDEVLPSLLEFVGDAVVVGHNVRFDLRFLRAALERADRPLLANRWLDTFALARRLVHDEVPNLRLATLASRFRLAHQPSHRALDDALATGELLHVLLERAGGLGVSGLDDLLALPTMSGHAQAGKLKLTSRLPRQPGVYLFKDRNGRVLYVGKATNLRSRVRSYFAGDSRKKIGSLLRETHHIDHEVCPHPLEAAVREVRLIHEHRPRYNRHARNWDKYVYVKLTRGEPYPRLSVVRIARDDGGLYLGPLPSMRFAKRVIEAIEGALPLRRCTAAPDRSTRSAPCAPAQLGVATCPCAGTISQAAYAEITDLAVRALLYDPEIVLAPLRQRMEALAASDRFEEAADVRDRAAAFAQALHRQRRFDALRRSRRVHLEIPGCEPAEICDGRLVVPGALDLGPAVPPADQPLPRELADELQCIAGWLDQRAHRVRLLHCEGELASSLPPLPTFTPRR